MQNFKLNEDARLENARALAASLGIDVEVAREKLSVNILITYDKNDISSSHLVTEITRLLTRTVSTVDSDLIEQSYSVEVVVGDVEPKSKSPHLFVSGCQTNFTLSKHKIHRLFYEAPHPILILLTSCYVCSVALNLAIGEILSTSVADPFNFEFSDLGLDIKVLDSPIILGKAYLVGAGAVGNGLLWALRHLNVDGELQVSDDDVVENGNLNRQIWFQEEDVGHSKVDRLCQKAQSHFSMLKLIPRNARLQKLEERNNAWLSRLIVAVDSPAARRSLQNEIPCEVFDASTTDIREVIVHYHKQVTDHACLACIYSGNEQETERDQHIASHLGVSVEQVKMLTIDFEAAEAIARNFSNKIHDPKQLVGIAYESLFKRLCGEKALTILGGRQIIAPFAFVSVLAGTLLAIELARRLQSGRHKKAFNFWAVSAWHPPLLRRQRMIPAKDDCDFCSKDVQRNVTRKLWGR